MKTNNIIIAFTSICCLLISCVNSNASKGTDATAQEYTETFDEIGFSITTPCKLNDVSAHSQGDFVINYGGVENENDQQRMAAYQVIVNRLPIGNRNLSTNQLESFVDDALQTAMRNFSNVEKISFGQEGYPGYVGYTTHNGLQQKGIMFSKGEYIIALTLMSNDNLEQRFNKFTNGFKSISSDAVAEPQSATNSQASAKSYPNLPERFSNSSFTLNYPSSWEIVRENARATAQTTIAVQVMDQNVGSNDFAPNVNVIVSTERHPESTAQLARIAFNQVKEAGISCKLIGISDCNLNGCLGSVADYTATVQGFTLHMYQYIVKKSDNKTFTITATIDNSKLSKQRPIVQDIVNSFTAK